MEFVMNQKLLSIINNNDHFEVKNFIVGGLYLKTREGFFPSKKKKEEKNVPTIFNANQTSVKGIV